MKELPATLLAQGRTAEIYLWDEQQVLKLFRDWCPHDWVEYEAKIAHAVYEAGIPSPALGEIIEVDGRRGLIYERLKGISMLEDMKARPWMVLEHARALADLQAQIHQQSIKGLPSYRDRLSNDIRETSQLNETLRNKALARLDTLPVHHNLCHGDYHPGNVIITKRGPVVIDWMTACTGARWADVARSSLILSVAVKAAGNQVSTLLRWMVRLYHHAYLRRYLKLIPNTGNELNRWMPVIAAARLNEEIEAERETLLKLVEEE